MDDYQFFAASRVCVLFAFFSTLMAQGQSRHIIVLDPGHSHAAAVFAQPIPGISDEVRVYAPPGPDVAAFLHSVSGFNHRPHNPTHWRLEPYVSADFLPHMLLEPPGNIVIISGRNNGKIKRILWSVRAGQNVLADKPWIIDSEEFPVLETTLREAVQRHVAVYDGMTERFNAAYRIQRELMRDPAVFGHSLTGTRSAPAVQLDNLHSLVKFDKGKVNLRPAWFLDVRQQGEAIADVGTHLVDLELWTLFPDQPVDYRRDIRVLEATNSPVYLTRSQFERVTGEKAWPPFLLHAVRSDQLEYDCNNTALFTVRGTYTSIHDRWEYESPGALNDSYLVLYRGSRSTIRVRQSKLENYLPEIDVIPNASENSAALTAALESRLKSIASSFPNLALRNNAREIRVVIPREDRERGGSTFAQLVGRFLEYASDPQTIPNWEAPNMLAKYYVTTQAVDLAHPTKLRLSTKIPPPTPAASPR
ncbi:MAG TPA: putative oxidoreductase C-terminal domain-containing protein [Bryobacteraceae bacterium]|nr:putative oxidoreductase C-terminal domain-containing protein [Bryobacteraceae bacterium]